MVLEWVSWVKSKNFRRKSDGIYKKPLELLSEVSNITGYKIKVQKLIIYLYILSMNNQKLKFKNECHFNIIQKMNYLRINLMKNV